jgi:hypothetical protein
MKNDHIEPIFVTGTERSGSALVARILTMCGVWHGTCNKMYEHKGLTDLHKFEKESLFPKTMEIQIPFNWKNDVQKIITDDNWTGQQWMVKSSKLAQYWPVWAYAYPDAKWLIVRRRTGDIIQSCVKTGYMQTFKGGMNLFNGETEEQGWLWWIHQYETKFVEMIEAGLNCRIVWPDRMVSGNYEQMKETIDWLGLKWNSKIPEVVEPLLEKSRRLEYGTSDS